MTFTCNGFGKKEVCQACQVSHPQCNDLIRTCIKTATCKKEWCADCTVVLIKYPINGNPGELTP